jgi:hypothetical protein
LFIFRCSKEAWPAYGDDEGWLLWSRGWQVPNKQEGHNNNTNKKENNPNNSNEEKDGQEVAQQQQSQTKNKQRKKGPTTGHMNKQEKDFQYIVFVY